MTHTDKISPAFPAGGIELARRQAQALNCGFSPAAMRALGANMGVAGPSWAIGTQRETGKARGAGAFPFRIGAAASA